MASAEELICLYRRQSSAKRRALDFVQGGRSLTHTRNSSGPRTVLWVHPMELVLLGMRGSTIYDALYPFQNAAMDIVMTEYLLGIVWSSGSLVGKAPGF